VVGDNPGVIYASGNLFDQTGPWADRPGWDHNAQAATGMSQTRAVDGRPKCLELPVNDFATGLFGALGVVLGLLHRDLTGKGVKTAVSLARSATILQQRDLVETPAVRGSGLEVQTVECRGGWVSIYPRPGEPVPPDILDKAIDMAPHDLCARLTRHGLAAAVENTVADLTRSTVLDDTGLRHCWQHPDLGPFTGTVPTGRIGDFLMTPRDPAPLPGQDNAQILAEIGRADDLPRLLGEGVVSRFDLFGQRIWANEPAPG
jgi:crotonobetainyl-CoA:carnitine CoA-transferase CaiB-like acyl-CoA transferase